MLRVHNIIPICDAGYRWSCIYMMTNIDWSLNIDGLIPSIKLVYKYYGSGPPSNYTTPTKSHTGPSWSMVVVRTVPVATQVVNSNPVHGDTTICDKVWQCKTSLDTEWPVFATAQKWRQTTPCIGFRAPAAENTPNSISVPRDCSNWSTRETKWSGYAPKVTSLPTLKKLNRKTVKISAKGVNKHRVTDPLNTFRSVLQTGKAATTIHLGFRLKDNTVFRYEHCKIWYPFGK